MALVVPSDAIKKRIGVLITPEFILDAYERIAEGMIDLFCAFGYEVSAATSTLTGAEKLKPKVRFIDMGDWTMNDWNAAVAEIDNMVKSALFLWGPGQGLEKDGTTATNIGSSYAIPVAGTILNMFSTSGATKITAAFTRPAGGDYYIQWPLGNITSNIMSNDNDIQNRFIIPVFHDLDPQVSKPQPRST